jgi:hypothetical protein
MWSLGPIQLTALVLAVAVIAAICGFIASIIVRRNRRRARGFFALGFLCGLMAGPALRRRRRFARALTSAALPVGWWPAPRRRRIRA